MTVRKLVQVYVFYEKLFKMIIKMLIPLNSMFNVTNFAADFIFIGTTNTTLERKDERDTDKKDRNTITRYIHYIKILVILVGTVSSLTLLLIIGREMFKLFRMSETWGNYHVAMVIPVVNNTFGDITESLYNSWGTQEHRNPLLATISFLNTSVE